MVNIGLIGCGTIANKHVTAISRLDNAKITCVYDTNPEAAKAFGEKYGLPWYSDLNEMVARGDPQIFSVLTPSGVHHQNVKALLQFGRDFVVEKPLALRLDVIDDILATCDANGQKIYVVQQNRFNPPIQKLKEALDNGRFGKLVLGTVRVRWARHQKYYSDKPWRGTWAEDGGVLTNQASHHIDMLIWMMGGVKSVMAKTATRLADIEAEDTGACVLQFENGALGIVEATTAVRPKDLEGSISILGEKGSVEVGGFFMNELKTWNFVDPDPMDDDIWEKYAKVPAEPAWNHSAFYRNVVNAHIQRKRGLIDGLDGRRSMEIISAIYESAETGKEVFLRFTPKFCRLGGE